MEEIRRQVGRARRRLVSQQFVQVVTWALSIFLVLGLIGVVIPKIWPLPINATTWSAAWLGGSFVAGLLTALVVVAVRRRNELDAAIEIDRRFHLKERVSSALALSERDLATEAGQALIEDAEQRVKRLDVLEQFPLQWSWRPLLPVATALAAFLVMFLVEDATREPAAAANSVSAETREQIEASTRQLQKKLAEERKRAEEKGLNQADARLFDKLQNGLDDMLKTDDVDRKRAMIKINDLSQELSKRRDALGSMDKMKKQLNQLKNLEQGPADKVAQALKQGNFNKALNELDKLQEKLAKEGLSEEEKQQLAKQLEELQKKLQQMAQAHEQAKRDLQEMIDQKKRAGDLAGAAELQKKLDQLNQQDQQMGQLAQMASKLGKSSDALKNGNQQAAAEQLSQLAENLEQLQAQMDQLETIESIMDQIADAKSAMNCPACNGQGCDQCQGAGMNGGGGNQAQQNGPPGNGMGAGQGVGDRPEERTDTGGYRARVGAKPRQGEAVRVGDASGPNVAGTSLEDVKNDITASYSEKADPQVTERLPRREREHLEEYFRRFRKGD